MREQLAAHPVEVVKERELLPETQVDFVLFMQVLANILQNVVNYTPEGTGTRIAIGAGSGGLSIEICDSGPGVTDSELPHLFDGSSAAGGRARGCGLASICKGIVRPMEAGLRPPAGRAGAVRPHRAAGCAAAHDPHRGQDDDAQIRRLL
jgi:K+-sensing histidine kinase KdpD